MSGVVTARQRGRANAAQFIASLSVYDVGWEPDEDISPVEDHHGGRFATVRPDHFDVLNGIQVRSSNQLVAERTAKKLALRKRYQAGKMLFSTDEVLEDSSIVDPVVVEIDPNDINRRLKWGYTPLIEAAVKGDFAECQRLKAFGADLTLEDNAGKRAWQKARDRGHVAIAKLLKV